jgi:hypothetical protein
LTSAKAAERLINSVETTVIIRRIMGLFSSETNSKGNSEAAELEIDSAAALTPRGI